MTQNDPGVPGAASPPGTVTTGDTRVDDALHKLADLAELPLHEHPAVFEHIHGALTGALGTLDSGTEGIPPAPAAHGTSPTPGS
ncbi:MAG TPA: hypothetical protein VMV92_14115 [Streptosporangiaceae bacterium]|nr:hypothetical protein [Streptosporangiaceae bacterium]